MNKPIHILSGEILSPRDGVRVIGTPHPLQLERLEFTAPPGASIAEIVAMGREKAECRFRTRWVVRLEGEPVPEEAWPRLRPKAGTLLTFHAVPEGQMGRSIFGILLAVAGMFIPGLLGLTGMMATLVGAGIMMGGSLLMGMLFPPPKPKLEEKDRQPAQFHALNGARNTASPWGTLPMVLGKHALTPLYAAKPYTETVGDDQFLICLFCWGYGRLNLADFKIGETPLTMFLDYDHRTYDISDFKPEAVPIGTPGNAPEMLFPDAVFEDQINVDMEPLEWYQRRTAEGVNVISVDFAYPQGMWAMVHGKKGTIRIEYGHSYEIQYRKVSATSTGAWTALGAPGNPVYKSIDPVRFTRRFDMPKGQYDVRVRRTNPKIDENHPHYEGVVEGFYLVAIRSMRTWQPPVLSMEPVVLTALRIRASSQLNGTIENYNGIASLRTWDWVSSENRWRGFRETSNPASLIRHVLQGPPEYEIGNTGRYKPTHANKRPVPDKLVDLDALQRFHGYCATKGFTYNRVVEKEMAVYDLVSEIAAAGRGIIVFRDGKWSVKWDEENTEIVQHFTPRNSWNFRSQRAYQKMPQAFRVRFINQHREYRQDEVIVFDDNPAGGFYDATTATDYETIEFPGVTTKALARKHGRFHIAQVRLRPETYRIDVDWESLVCTRGDRVLLSHDVPLIGQVTGRVKAISGNVVTLDETCVVVPGRLYGLRFRRKDGGSSWFRATGSIGEVNALALTGNDPYPEVGDLFIFGEYDVETSAMRVLSIEPAENLTATVTLVDDAPAIAQADRRLPPFDDNITAPVDLTRLPPTDIQVREELVVSGTEVRANVTITWTVVRTGIASAYEVQILLDGMPDAAWRTIATVPSPQTIATVFNILEGRYSFRVRALFPDGGFSFWATVAGVQIAGIYFPPPDVETFRIDVLGALSTLSWSPVNAPHLAHYEIRYSPRISGVTWGSATVLVPAATGSSIQVPTLDGTYLIKAVSLVGVYSVNERILTSTMGAIAGLNVVEQVSEGPTFPGQKYSVEQIGSVLQLAAAEVIAAWVRLAFVPNLYTGTSGLTSHGLYQFGTTFDLSQNYVSRITAFVDAYGLNLFANIAEWIRLSDIELLNPTSPAEWETTIQVRTTEHAANVGPWTEWTDFVVGDHRARCLQFRVLMEGNESRTVTPVVAKFTVRIDMPDRIVAEEDMVVPGAGRRIVFDPPFKKLEGVSITVQDRASGDREYINPALKDETGFNIQVFNSVGAGIQRTIDYLAKGYGVRVPPITLPGGGIPVIGFFTGFEFDDRVVSAGALTFVGVPVTATAALSEAGDTATGAAILVAPRTATVAATEAADTASSQTTLVSPVTIGQNDIVLVGLPTNNDVRLTGYSATPPPQPASLGNFDRSEMADVATSGAVRGKITVANLTRTEAGDTLNGAAFIGAVGKTSTVGVAEAGDVAASGGTLRLQGQLSASEAGDVVMATSGGNRLGNATATEGVDTLSAGALAGGAGVWILQSGTWNDTGQWGDTETWNDGLSRSGTLAITEGSDAVSSGASKATPNTFRYWRILFTDYFHSEVSGQEIELRSTLGGTDQTTPSTPAFESASLYGTTAVGLVDNDVNNWTWYAAHNNQQQWVMFDLGTSKPIVQFTYKATHDAWGSPRGMNLQGSDSSNGPWTTVITVTNLATWTGYQVRTFSI